MKMDILEMVNSMSIYFQLFFASFFWGSNVIVMKLLLNQLPFLFLAFLRVLLSFLFLGLYIYTFFTLSECRIGISAIAL